MEKLVTIPLWFFLFTIIATSVLSVIIYKSAAMYSIKMYCIKNFSTEHGAAYLDIYKKLL